MTFILVNWKSPLETVCVTHDDVGDVQVLPMSLRDAVRLAEAQGDDVDFIPFEGRSEALEFVTDELGDVDLRTEDDSPEAPSSCSSPFELFDAFDRSDERDSLLQQGDPYTPPRGQPSLDPVYFAMSSGDTDDGGAMDFDIDIDVDAP